MLVWTSPAGFLAKHWNMPVSSGRRPLTCRLPPARTRYLGIFTGLMGTASLYHTMSGDGTPEEHRAELCPSLCPSIDMSVYYCPCVSHLSVCLCLSSLCLCVSHPSVCVSLISLSVCLSSLCVSLISLSLCLSSLCLYVNRCLLIYPSVYRLCVSMYILHIAIYL